MQQLDKDNTILRWEYETMKIPYDTKLYIVDFTIYYNTGEIYLVELKDREEAKKIDNQIKFKHADKFCKENNFKFVVKYNDEVE